MAPLSAAGGVNVTRPASGTAQAGTKDAILERLSTLGVPAPPAAPLLQVAIVTHGHGRYRLMVIRGGVICLLGRRYRSRRGAAWAAARIMAARDGL